MEIDGALSADEGCGRCRAAWEPHGAPSPADGSRDACLIGEDATFFRRFTDSFSPASPRVAACRSNMTAEVLPPRARYRCVSASRRRASSLHCWCATRPRGDHAGSAHQSAGGCQAARPLHHDVQLKNSRTRAGDESSWPPVVARHLNNDQTRFIPCCNWRCST